MKSVFAFLLVFGFFHSAQAVEPTASIDMSKPPYWLSSYAEMSRLRKSQKAFLIGKLDPIFEKIPSLKEFTKSKLQEAIKDQEKWNDLRLKVYVYCADAAAVKTCESLADTRLDAIDFDAVTQIGPPKKSAEPPKKK
jgi:hypothetical protein